MVSLHDNISIVLMQIRLENCTLKTTTRIIILKKIPTQSPDTENIMENKQFPYK